MESQGPDWDVQPLFSGESLLFGAQVGVFQW